MKGLDVLGCPMAIATANDASLPRPRLAQVLAWAESGAIRPHVSHTYKLDEVKDALRAKWAGDVVGNCVLRVEGLLLMLVLGGCSLAPGGHGHKEAADAVRRDPLETTWQVDRRRARRDRRPPIPGIPTTRTTPTSGRRSRR